uniref:NAD(P)(+)--arginine ADP-ribosyltransferase n=1 Tax=Salmo trutta TaxID=8032 RepID=A0A674ENF5_SALTR
MDMGERISERLSTIEWRLGGNVNVYNGDFRLKSLHFLMMVAMRLLRTEKCQTVFRGSSKKYEAQAVSEVRFGRFTSTRAKRSNSQESATNNGTLFNITSCTVVNVDAHTCDSESIEQLFSSAEVFSMAEVYEGVNNEDEEYSENVLTNSRIHGNHDCYLFSRLL